MATGFIKCDLQGCNAYSQAFIEVRPTGYLGSQYVGIKDPMQFCSYCCAWRWFDRLRRSSAYGGQWKETGE